MKARARQPQPFDEDAAKVELLDVVRALSQQRTRLRSLERRLSKLPGCRDVDEARAAGDEERLTLASALAGACGFVADENLTAAIDELRSDARRTHASVARDEAKYRREMEAQREMASKASRAGLDASTAAKFAEALDVAEAGIEELAEHAQRDPAAPLAVYALDLSRALARTCRSALKVTPPRERPGAVAEIAEAVDAAEARIEDLAEQARRNPAAPIAGDVLDLSRALAHACRSVLEVTQPRERPAALGSHS